MALIRNVIGMSVGCLIFASSALALFKISGRDPHVNPGLGFLVLTTVYGIAIAFLAGYVAAAIAHGHSAGVLIGVVLALVAALSIYWQLHRASIWTEVAALLFMAPAAAVGGVARASRFSERH
jgi:hypothetical protein